MTAQTESLRAFAALDQLRPVHPGEHFNSLFCSLYLEGIICEYPIQAEARVQPRSKLPCPSDSIELEAEHKKIVIRVLNL